MSERSWSVTVATAAVLPSVLTDQLAKMGSDTTYLAVVDRDGE